MPNRAYQASICCRRVARSAPVSAGAAAMVEGLTLTAAAISKPRTKATAAAGMSHGHFEGSGGGAGERGGVGGVVMIVPGLPSASRYRRSPRRLQPRATKSVLATIPTIAPQGTLVLDRGARACRTVVVAVRPLADAPQAS